MVCITVTCRRLSLRPAKNHLPGLTCCRVPGKFTAPVLFRPTKLLPTPHATPLDSPKGALIYLHQTSKGYFGEKLGEQLTLQFHHEQRLETLPESQRHTQREIGFGVQFSRT